MTDPMQRAICAPDCIYVTSAHAHCLAQRRVSAVRVLLGFGLRTTCRKRGKQTCVCILSSVFRKGLENPSSVGS